MFNSVVVQLFNLLSADVHLLAVSQFVTGSSIVYLLTTILNFSPKSFDYYSQV